MDNLKKIKFKSLPMLPPRGRYERNQYTDILNSIKGRQE